MTERVMTVAVSGASGLVGTRLVQVLRAEGDTVVRLVRRQEQVGPDAVLWDPETGRVDGARLEGVDAVVHLAGENLASGRWTERRKERIRRSRVEGTRALCVALAGLERPPETLVSASAIGFYGDRGSIPVDERAAPGTGFLVEVCRAWEEATAPAAEAGIRVVLARLGVVLAAEGGALATMRVPFSLGLGGRLGDGRQPMSWISLEDAARALAFCLRTESLRGPVNVVAPGSVSNADFTAALARALHRPAVLPVPGFAAKLGLGSEMAQEMLLGGAHVVPRALTAAGFTWLYPDIDEGLRAALG